MPPSPNQHTLNIIALISGGKDSLYSLLHSLRNGHRIVALANLHPDSTGKDCPRDQSGGTSNDNDDDGTDEEDDIDSFMYQTVGHAVIPLYESALGIPLYRGRIVGGAVDEGRVYGLSTPQSAEDDGDGAKGEDETESLIPLLKRIKSAHPEANALSAGAILSTYQRTRVEHVAARLNLVPLAWLWMYPFLPEPVERRGVGSASDAGLLEDMAAVGCEARIIKVASGGLDEGFLWGNVSGAEPGLRRRLVKQMRPFAGDGDVRGAVLGEGGEYETLALDGPGFLWKQRIEIVERLVRRAEGGVGYLRLKGARCVPKEDCGPVDGRVEDVRRPGLLDGVFEDALDELVASSAEDGDTTITDSLARLDLNEGHLGPGDILPTRNGGLWTISNISAPDAGPGPGEQMEGIAGKTQALLESAGNRSSDDIIFATVLLHSMADFVTVNAAYASLFKKPNPPARVTVACGNRLPEGVKIMVSFVVDLSSRGLRQGLHVQSRSYWAPANIGPYSQAMSIPLQETGRLVYVAGQIPLEPASMEIASRPPPTEDLLDNYSLRAVLSLQHLWRIGTAVGVDWWLGAVAFLAGEDSTDAKARMAWRLWKWMHTQKDEEIEEDEPELDAWDVKYGRRADQQKSKPARPANLPNFAVVQSRGGIPPFFAAQVEELPRGSDIEWQGLGCLSGRVTVAAGEIDHGRWSDTTVDGFTYTGIEIEMGQSNLVSQCLQNAVNTHSQHPGAFHTVVYATSPLLAVFLPGQIVPCKAVWGREGRRLAAGVVLQRRESD